MAAIEPKTVGGYRAALGEGPLWDHRRDRLLYCDILARRLIVTDAEGRRERFVEFAQGITAIGLAEDGGYVAASERRAMRLDSDFAMVWQSDEVEPDRPANRCNDGKVDAAGRFWIGTMERDCRGRSGAFHRLDGPRIARIDDGYRVANGPAFAPSGEVMCCADTMDGIVYRADATLAGKQPFVRFEPGEGLPDGMTYDEDGRLYVAHFGGHAISRYRPDGTRDAKFELPATNITSLCFGGPDLTTLFATSAHCTFDAAERIARPDEGALFAFDCGARGRPEPLYRLATEPLP